MKQKLWFFYFLVCIFLTLKGLGYCKTQTINSLNEILISKFSKDTLVLVDIDDVLIYPQDALLQNWRKMWKPDGVREWTPEEDTIAWMSAAFQLMDPYGPSLIKALNDIEIPTFGFTSFAMEQSGILKSVPEWRSKQLRELGINFMQAEEIVFSTQEGFVPPSFEGGVLYCGDYYKKDADNKGKILSLFLDWLDWTPDQIVLIDDGKKNLQSVQKESERRGIPFLGFLYTPKELDPIDETVAELQYMTLINEKIWLSDWEALSLLQSKCF